MLPRRHRSCSHRRGALAIACAAVLLSACFYNSNAAGKQQARYAQKIAPARVGQKPTKVFDSIKTLKVRVYAEAPYRNATLHWKEKFQRLVGRVNGVIRPLYGVELEVVEMLAWERTGTGNSLTGLLEELEIVDPADDVDFVIGLVSQLDSAATDLTMLGLARPLSAHWVMRGMNDVAERKLFDRVFDELSAADRERLFQARKRHKELTVFLHEWAHTLGAPHTRNAVAIMNVAYDSDVREFAPLTVGIVEIGLKYRGIGVLSDKLRAEMYKELADFIKAADRSFWIDSELSDLLAMLEMNEASGPTERASANLTPDARRSFYRALDQEREGRYEEAWKIIFPMTETYREEAQVQVFGCRLATRVKQLAWPAPETCNLAMQLAPNDPTPHLAMARAYHDAGDAEHALASLRKAHEVLDGAAEAKQAQWLELASAYHERELFTWGEQALSHVTDNAVAADMQRFSRQTRRRYGLPSPGDEYGIAPEREGEYLAAVKQALSQVYGNQFAEAKKLVAQGRKDYPKAPGFLVVECDLQMRIGKLAAARKSCTKAIARWDEAMWAHYLIGVMDARHEKHASAIEHLERAIDLDPEMKALWKLLAQVYESAGEKQELDRLERLYRGQFGEKL